MFDNNYLTSNESLLFPHCELRWINRIPPDNRKIALLVPQFNESSKPGFLSRLAYFSALAREFHASMDVVLIDDGSTDSSLAIMSEFIEINQCGFYLASVFPNANKVGALQLGVNEITHEIVVLTDFDTDLRGMEAIDSVRDDLISDDRLMGGYFRMLPFEGSGLIFDFQKVEYCLHRSLYRLTEGQGAVPVMPGAGSVFKRSTLLEIYQRHSGQRNGEDREATSIGLSLGYSAKYFSNIVALTRPPLTIGNLVNQRVRWNLGYIETWHKERRFYWSHVERLDYTGILSAFDLFFALLAACYLLVTFSLLFFFGIQSSVLFSVVIYAVFLSFELIGIAISPREFADFKGNLVSAILLYPVIKIVVGQAAWLRAFRFFFKANHH